MTKTGPSLRFPLASGEWGFSTAHANSLLISAPLVRLILQQETQFDPKEISHSVNTLRKEVDLQSDNNWKHKVGEILAGASEEAKFCMTLNSEKGA